MERNRMPDRDKSLGKVDAEREATPSWRAWVLLLVSVALLGATVFCFASLAKYPIVRAARAIEFPFQLDAEEGFLLGQAARLRSGEGLYGAIDAEPYVVDNYPPLYPTLWSVAARWSGESLAAGRWISALSALAAGLAILTAILGQGPLGSMVGGLFKRGKSEGAKEKGDRGLWRRVSLFFSLTQSVFLAATCGLLFLSSYALVRWVGYARVDLLSVALSAWGVAVFGLFGSRESARWGRWAAVGFFALALFTKQTSLAGPGACLIYLAVRDRKGAIWFAAAMALTVGLPVAVLCVWTGGRYWLHTVTYNKNVMYWNELSLWALHLWRFYGPLIVALVLLSAWALWEMARGALRGEKREQDRDTGAPIGMYFLYFALNVLSLATLAKAGATENYLLEPICATAIFMGVGLGALLGKANSGKGRWLRAGLAVGVLLLLVFQGFRYSGLGRRPYYYGGILAYSSAPGPSLPAFVAGERVVREIKNRPGPVLCEDPVYLMRAGREIVFQNFIMTQLAKEGKWDESPMIERVRRGEFSLVVAHKDLENEDQFFNRYSPALREAIRGRYRLLDRLERPPPLQTIFLYVPSSADPPIQQEEFKVP